MIIKVYFAGYTKDNSQKVVILGPFRNNEEKEQWMMTSAVVFSAYYIDKYIVMIEGWAIKTSRKSFMPLCR